ncbi:MBL fold metallo-hydrolase [Priestia filamentosa]|uniref:MBL fold metallo-hydrolase n=1 Tax=Priestia filamentosa TaxID=1402861 RepID=UPI002E2060CD|nr:MBL fold metallo-hydrolase [Priestia filamentosa]
MKIAEGLEILKLEMGSGEQKMIVYPTVIYDKESCVLVDTGMPGYAKELYNLMSEENLNPERLTGVLLTHQDIDHIGSLPQLIEENENLHIYAHEEDRPYIDGEKPFIKLDEEKKKHMTSSLNEHERLLFDETFYNPENKNVTHVLKDGETLPIADGIKVIHTPGHTPGHISLYHEQSKTLIAGDAMIVENGELLGPNPPFTPNMEQALESLNKFKHLEIETLIGYHGGIFKGDIEKRLQELTSHSKS